MNTDGVLQDRYWRVINQNQKHLELVYSKKIQVVPARDHYVEGVN
jgi:Txe/YoeB family toxin of Txe-Axe toxin-antitoxin module